MDGTFHEIACCSISSWRGPRSTFYVGSYNGSLYFILINFTLLPVNWGPWVVKHDFKVTKCQLISKGLFGVFNFLKKTKKTKSNSSKIVFICSFFGGNVSLKKSIRLFLTFSSCCFEAHTDCLWRGFLILLYYDF